MEERKELTKQSMTELGKLEHPQTAKDPSVFPQGPGPGLGLQCSPSVAKGPPHGSSLGHALRHSPKHLNEHTKLYCLYPQGHLKCWNHLSQKLF